MFLCGEGRYLLSVRLFGLSASVGVPAGGAFCRAGTGPG